jgi:serine/threonine protein kinase
MIDSLYIHIRSILKLLQLGAGAFSVVYEVTHKKSQHVYAVKVAHKEGLTEEDLVALKDEISVMNELKHPNIIQLLEVYEEISTFYVVMEKMEGGELFERIVQKKCYNEKEARDIIKTLLETIQYMHEKKIAHRDLKPDNILLVVRNTTIFLSLSLSFNSLSILYSVSRR